MTAPDTAAFFTEDLAANYDRQFARLEPFMEALLLSARIALSDLPANARILCVGAGTGREIMALAKDNPGWRFIAVEPSAAMMARCRENLDAAGLTDRCTFHTCYLADAPQETADAATMILVSQFLLDPEHRRALFAEIARRLEPGAPLFSADLARPDGPEGEALFEHWMAAMTFNGFDAEKRAGYRDAVSRAVAIDDPGRVAALIASAGFDAPVRIAQTALIQAWIARRA